MIAGRKAVYKLKDVLRFSCFPGHRLYGPTSLRCKNNGQWESALPTCDQVQCYRPPTIPMGHPKVQPGDVFSVGQTVSYQCDEGYRLAGSMRTVSCESDGNWTTSHPRCTVVRCPRPLIPHGRASGSNQYDRRMVFNCVAGYQRQGVHYAHCTSEGTWSSPIPTCTEKTCPPPTDITNGQVTYTKLTYRSTITYTCNEGFTLKGPRSRRCLEEPRWSESQPTCVHIECLEPKSLKNGQISGDTYIYNRTITYTCDSGYILTGLSQRRCGLDGEWTPRAAQCEKATCVPHQPPVNGRIEPPLGPYRYQDEITFICDKGFVFSGMPTRTKICKGDGNWTGIPKWKPKCQRVCSKPPAVQYGKYNSTGVHKLGSLIKITCQKGYRLKGKATRTCRVDGTWSGPNPTCVRLKCQKPGKVNHGKYLLQDTNLGAVAEFQCDQGYEIKGPNKRKCSENQHWSDEEPECLEMGCPDPVDIEHGKVYGDHRQVGAKISYKCEPGYSLRGAFERTCAAELKWSKESPTCELIECTKPSKVIANGRMTSLNFSHGSTIEYVCDLGYYIDGVATRTCDVDGLWDTPIPVCEAVNCNRPLRVPNSQLSGFDYRYGQKVVYNCKKGYNLVGEAERECQANITWSGTAPSCVRIRCGQPEVISNGQMRLSGVYYNHVVTYVCDHGYHLVGSDTRTCGLGNQWSGEHPVCSQVTCGLPPAVRHAVTLDTSAAVDQFPQYECVSGYRMEEQSRVVCGSRGTYSGDGPVCVNIVCARPAIPEHGRMTVKSDVYNGTVTFQCDRDYKLIGDAVLRCGEEGEWVGRAPFCVKDLCPPPPPLFNGTVLTNGNRIGSVAHYYCDTGHRLRGMANRTCTNDMVWRGDEPSCQPIQCPIPLITNGSVLLHGSPQKGQQTDYLYGSTITVLCERGFNLSTIGQGLACLATGTWSLPLPSCDRVHCPTPFIPHSLVNTNLTYVYEDTIQVDCEPGYQLEGESEVQCSESGAWSDEFPSCYPITCPTPAAFNGHIHVITSPNEGYGYALGMRLGFDCNEGFRLVGASEVTCQQDETWSDRIPVCEYQVCPLPSPQPGSSLAGFTQDNYTMGDSIHFFCTVGFEMIGPSSLMCLEGQVWNGTFPNCQVVKCFVLELTQGLVLTSRIVDYNKNVTVSCRDGYQLTGEPVSRCLADKSFDPPVAQCLPVTCPEGDIENGSGGQGNFSFGDRVTFRCDNRYSLIGESLVACTKHGNWSSAWPKCVSATCPDITGEGQRVVSEHEEGEPFTQGVQVTLGCDITHELVDPRAPTLVTCLSTGEWSRALPQCQAKLCDMPDTTYSSATINGDKLVTSHNQLTLGTFMAIGCDQGYFLQGSAHLICMENKEWSEPLPTCQRVTCPSFTVDNAILSSANFTYGSTINVVCNLGYELFGDYQLSCLSTASWSSHPPACHMIQCPSPAINYGTFHRSGSEKGSFMFGHSVRFSCLAGFTLVGEPEIVCQPDKTWSSSLPVCERKICQSPPSHIIRGTIQVISPPGQTPLGNNTFGTRLNFNCNLGYELDSHGSATCQANERWSVDFPNCVQIFCPQPLIMDGYVELFANDRMFTFGDSIRFRCDPGFELEGEPEGFCQPNKEWTIDFPTCSRIQCEPPVDIEHGTYIGDSYFYDDWVTYKCEVGFQIEGQNAVKCLTDRSWSSLPSCIPVTCPRAHVIEHGSYSVTGYIYR